MIRVNRREECIVQDISFEGGLARMSFQLKNGEILERTIRTDEVNLSPKVDCRISVTLRIVCPTIASTVSATLWP